MAFSERSEEYKSLYKYLKNVEAEHKQEQKKDLELMEILKDIEKKDQLIRSKPLQTSQEDIDSAKASIDRGDLNYTENDMHNT